MTVTTTVLNNKLRELEGKLRKEYNDQLIKLNACLGEQRLMLTTKDQEIGNLNRELGLLQQTCNFLTQETADLKGLITSNKLGIDTSNKSIKEIGAKTVDLEDRSRRQNLVFYGIPEEKINSNKEREKCDEKLTTALNQCNIPINTDYTMVFDRVHRLGKFKKDATKPRPIIAKFTYYRDKETVLSKRRNLAGFDLSMSEDYSKTTLDIHRELVNYAKEAKDKLPDIKSLRITYRRVTLRYEPPQKTAFSKSFTLKDINDGKDNWYLP